LVAIVIDDIFLLLVDKAGPDMTSELVIGYDAGTSPPNN